MELLLPLFAFNLFSANIVLSKYRRPRGYKGA